MAILSVGEGYPLLEKKPGTARNSKKIKRQNLVHFDWSAEQEPVSSSSAQHLESSNKSNPSIARDEEVVSPTALKNSAGVQEQVQDVEPGNGASPKPVGEAEAIAPTPSDSSRGVQKQLQTVEYSDEISPGFSGKAVATISFASNIDPELEKLATIPRASTIDPEFLTISQAAEATPKFAGNAEATIPTEPELSETSSDSFATAAESISSPDVQRNDALPYDSHSPTNRGQTGEDYAFQQDQEGQSADNLSSENMRPNAQNLRYGGYPAQPAPQHRNTPLGSGRLQNTSKLGGFEILHHMSYNGKADASELIR